MYKTSEIVNAVCRDRRSRDTTHHGDEQGDSVCWTFRPRVIRDRGEQTDPMQPHADRRREITTAFSGTAA